MPSLKSRLPPLNALLTFEAAARLASFTRAAAELHVSQAAVSRQIRRLEEQFGVPLFHRSHRAVELTDPGRRLHRAVADGFGQIATASGEIGATHGHAPVLVATTVACATYWFMPRLNRFHARHPQVDVRVLASDRYQDHVADNVDVAITCGLAEMPGWQTSRLFSEVVFPVCSTDYLARNPVADLHELARHSLLHLDRRHWEDIGWEPVDWQSWLQQFAIDYRPGHPLVTLNNYPMLVQAALAGEGIALGWSHLSDDLVADGRLVRPVEEQWDFKRGYHLAVRDKSAETPEVASLCDWLRAPPPPRTGAHD